MSQKKTKTRAAGCRQWRTCSSPPCPFPVSSSLSQARRRLPSRWLRHERARLLSTGHGIFEGAVTHQFGGGALSTPQKRTSPVFPPAGTYRVPLDIQAPDGP